MSTGGLTETAAGEKLNATASELSAKADERPEIPVAAAFGGGLVLAMILKKLASR